VRPDRQEDSSELRGPEGLGMDPEKSVVPGKVANRTTEAGKEALTGTPERQSLSRYVAAESSPKGGFRAGSAGLSGGGWERTAMDIRKREIAKRVAIVYWLCVLLAFKNR